MLTEQPTRIAAWQDVYCRRCTKKIGRIRSGVSEFQCKHCGKVNIVKVDDQQNLTVTIDR